MLRARLRVALVAKEPPVVAVLRESLAAIDNAEAAPLSISPATVHGAFAGSAGGLGAGEVERLVLAPLRSSILGLCFCEPDPA